MTPTRSGSHAPRGLRTRLAPGAPLAPGARAGLLAASVAVAAPALTGCVDAGADASAPTITVTSTAVETLTPATTTPAPLEPLTAEEAFGVCDAMILRDTSPTVTYTREGFADATVVQRSDGWWYVGVEGTTQNERMAEPVASGDYCIMRGTVLDAEIEMLHSGLGSIADLDPEAPFDDPQWGTTTGPGGI